MMEFGKNGKDDIPYMKWKIEVLFQTTNQYIILYHYHSNSIIPNLFL